METNLVIYQGQIHFDPVNATKKHNTQSSWKRVAMIMLGGDITEYYSWFLYKRYNIILNKPLRGAHVTFINDSLNDMMKGLQTENEDLVETLWNNTKEKWDNKIIDVTFNLDPYTNGKHWWIIVDHAYRQNIHDIRAELGLGRPYFGLHMSLGYANERNVEHSEYIGRITERLI